MAARLYAELADWWPLLSPPDDYADEAADLLPLLQGDEPPQGRPTLLELGAGGGSLAFHLAPHFELTLTDISEPMLQVSRRVNPACEHIAGDMRTLRLGREFDAVLIHDAIEYMTTAADVQAALATAAVHCRPGGRLVVVPDHVRETFKPATEHGGLDAPDGRGLRYLEWSWDPDPADSTYETAYAFLLRTPDGRVDVQLDRHRHGLHSRQVWMTWLTNAGFSVRVHHDAWDRDVFVGVKREN